MEPLSLSQIPGVPPAGAERGVGVISSGLWVCTSRSPACLSTSLVAKMFAISRRWNYSRCRIEGSWMLLPLGPRV